jgi:hypothetical protein
LKFPQGNLAELVLEMAVMDKISLFGKGLGAIRAKIGPTSDADKTTTTLLINCCYQNLL